MKPAPQDPPVSDGCVLKTGRGVYLLKLEAAPELSETHVILPLVLEHRGGLERVGFLCRLPRRGASPGQCDPLPGQTLGPGHVAYRELLARVAARVEGKFEQLREAALKSIRGEHRLLQIEFDEPAV